MKSLRIAFLTDYLNMLAGTEASLIETALELVSDGHSALVGNFQREGAAHPYWKQVLEDAGIPLCVNDSGESEIAFCRRLSCVLREWKADVVHAIPLGSLTAPWFQANDGDSSPPCIATETSEASPRCTWYDWNALPPLQNFRALVAPCRRVANGLRDTFGYQGRLEVIPHVVAVPEERIRPMTRSDLRFLRHLGAITRLRFEKGPEFMLATLAILSRDYDVDLTIYGETPELERTQALAHALGISQRVAIAGPFKGAAEMDQIVERHCIFLLTSLFEGLPLALLNVTARGRLAVSTDTGGASEILTPMDPRCIVRVADPAAMASAIALLLDQPAHVLELSHRAVDSFRRQYHKAKVTTRLVQFYRSVKECARL